MSRFCKDWNKAGLSAKDTAVEMEVIEQMNKDAKVTAAIPADRVADLSALREVRVELNKKKTD
jgi:hypothetical protein